MIDNGWIKARRFWWSSRLFKRRPGDRLSPFEFWIWLCFEANWDDNPRHNPPLFRGDLLSTRGKLAKVANWTTSEVRSFLDRVERAGLIKTRAIGRGTVISIIDYESAQPAPNQRSTSAQPAPNGAQQYQALTDQSAQPALNQRPTSAQPALTYTEEPRIKNQTSGDKSPEGDGVLVDERGNEWKPAPKKGRVSYSVPFGEIWKLWLDAKRRAPDSVKAPDKPRAYMLVRGHIQDGTATAGEIYTATKNYLEPFASGRERYCKHPTTFYRVRAPLFLEHIEATAPDGKPLITLAAFRNDPTYALNCARVAQRRLDQTATDFDDGAGWDDFQALPQEVKLIAVRVASE